jgi:phage host-nuclease inhibitor protein Gam
MDENKYPEVENRLREYAKTEAFIARKEAEMNQKIQKIKEKYDEETKEARTTKKNLFEELKTFALLKPKLFDKKRSLGLVYGKIGFRTGTPKVMLLNRKYNWKTVIELLEKIFGMKYLRVKTEPNKDAILSDAAQKQLSDSELAAVGLKIDQNEKFFIDVDWDKIDEINQ